MVDVVSIVIAVIAFVGTLLTAGVTAWFTYFSDERKRRREAEAFIARYRDPLLLACQDLQSRLYNITDHRITAYFREDGDRKDSLLLYTAFVVGQFFSWTYILRRKTQFLRFRTDKANRKLTNALAKITFEFGTDKYPEEGAPFILWRGQQMALGEAMTDKDGDELFCIGYAAFRQKWMKDRPVHSMSELVEASKTSQAPMVSQVEEVTEGVEDGGYILSGEFRQWFRSIVEDITKIAKAKVEGHATVPDQRLRRLQHLLLDLIDILDKNHLRSEAKWTGPCHRAEECECSRCDGESACPREDCPWHDRPSDV